MNSSWQCLLLLSGWMAACSSGTGSPVASKPPKAEGGGVVPPTEEAGIVSPSKDAGTVDHAAFEASTPDAAIAPVMPGVWRKITVPTIDPTQNPCTDIQYDPSVRTTLIAMYGGNGLWKSTDAGASWTAIASTPALTSLGRVRIDPSDSMHLYATGSVIVGSLGFWVSHDGGKTFAVPANFTAGAAASTWNMDVYNLVVDPTDFNHVLLDFHNAWGSTNYAGIVETLDGGVTFVAHPFTSEMFPPGNPGYGGGVAFLYNPALGLGDAKRWLVGGGYAPGLFITTDAGGTWSAVNPTWTDNHGGFDAHYSTQGFLYIGGFDGVYRSTDNGASWGQVAEGAMADTTYSVIGDGKKLYTSPAFVGIPPMQPLYVADEGGTSEGTAWTALSSVVLPNGPWRMVFDDANRIIYSANWDGGAWAMTAM